MSRRSVSLTLLIAGCAIAAAALVLVFLLTITTNNRALYERHYVWLLWVNIGVATALGLVILLAVARLVVRTRRGKFGSRLLLKLAAIFALVGVLPGALIYGVSYQFVSRSIESWFDVKVEGALEAGLNLGRGTLQILVNELAGKVRVAADRSTDSPERLQVLALERLREQLSAQSVTLLAPNGQTLASAGSNTGSFDAPVPAERPTTAMMRQARAAHVVALLEGLDDDGSNRARPVRARIRALAWIPSASISLGNDELFLQVIQLIPPELAANALAVQAAYGEYQQRALGREGLRRMYVGTLTLTLILAVFIAFLLAAALGQQLARPLVVLADGVRQVARGDLRPTEIFASRDELGGLTKSFADMTQQLADARGLAQHSLGAAEHAKAELQTILDNLTAGVIVFDAQGRIDSVNPGATRILRAPLYDWLGQPLSNIPALAGFAEQIEQRRIQAEANSYGEPERWQDSFELLSEPDHASLTLLVRGAALPADKRLMVIDDISDIVSAQRSVAWAEVARRLAHEIKNPLTPIQLSAERLQHKLTAKLEGADQQMLARSVATIVNQVQAMKQLVNEFRDYSRLPSAKLEPLDLNSLIGEVLTLYASAQEADRLRCELDTELPRIEGDASQLRQVIHNLVQNALDATAERDNGLVTVQTQLLKNDDHGAAAVRLRVTDNGPGFSDKVLQRAFEPYVTTKTRGTGLGLAVVKKIVEEHGARVQVRNLQDMPASAAANSNADQRSGAQVSISFSRWVPRAEPAADRSSSRGVPPPTVSAV
ncbi:MAG: HAMP domain-containing protein [Burkholderiales bacterium]|nr:HAMP domain-containing protein [Burkholderiales bacterium]